MISTASFFNEYFLYKFDFEGQCYIRTVHCSHLMSNLTPPDISPMDIDLLWMVGLEKL